MQYVELAPNPKGTPRVNHGPLIQPRVQSRPRACFYNPRSILMERTIEPHLFSLHMHLYVRWLRHSHLCILFLMRDGSNQPALRSEEPSGKLGILRVSLPMHSMCIITGHIPAVICPRVSKGAGLHLMCIDLIYMHIVTPINLATLQHTEDRLTIPCD